MEKILTSLVQNVRENIPGYIAISVAEIASGESLASDSVDTSFDPALACAYNVEIINAKRKAIDILGLQENINDIHFKLDNHIHIVDMSPSGEYFIYLAVDSNKANLALTRSMLRKYKQELNEVL